MTPMRCRPHHSLPQQPSCCSPPAPGPLLRPTMPPHPKLPPARHSTPYWRTAAEPTSRPTPAASPPASADSLVSLDAGAVSVQPRNSVRAMFLRYFAGAHYHAWEDVEAPRVILSADRSLAWGLTRRVRGRAGGAGRPRRPTPPGLRLRLLGDVRLAGGPVSDDHRHLDRAAPATGALSVEQRLALLRRVFSFAPPCPAPPLFAVLLAISFCHLLNDMMQSLLPAMYPMLKTDVRARLRADRPDHAHLPAHGVAAAAAGRALHRPHPQAVLAGDRHGLHAGRAVCCCRWRAASAVLLVAAGARGARLVRLPPGVFARRADGVRRAARPGAVAVPGRRQRRLGARAAAGRVHRAAARPGERRVVLAGGAARHRSCCGASAAGTSVSRAAASRPSARRRRRRHPTLSPAPGAARARRAARADLLEVRLPGEL